MAGEKGKSILLVEDEVLIAMTEKIELENRGYVVTHVTTGEDAVEFVAKSNAQLDLVLMDIDLGSGIDGTQAAQTILNTKDIPIVFLSSHTEKEIVEKTEKITSYGYAVKNSSIVVLDASIKMALKLFDEKIKNKQADKKLHESEQRLRLIFNSMDEVPLQGYDKNRRVIYWNPGSEKLYGYTKEEAIGRTLEELILPEEIQEDVIEAIHQWHDYGVPIPAGEIELLDKNGNRLQVYSNHVLITNFSGEKEMFCIDVDLTKKKQFEGDLKKSEEKFRTFIENANDIIYQVNPEGVFTYASPNWVEILGYQLDEVIGEPVGKFVHKEDLHLCSDFLNLVLSTGEKQSGVEYRVKHKSGNWRWHVSNGSPIRDENGKVVSYMGIARDITERKKVEEKLIKSEKRLLEAQMLSHVGSWEYYIENDRVEWSEGLYDIFELPKDKPPPAFLKQQNLYSEDSFNNLKQAIGECLDNETPYKVTLDIITFNGSLKKIISKGKILKDSADKVIGCFGTAQDITQQKKLESELLESKKRAEENEKIAKTAECEIQKQLEEKELLLREVHHRVKNNIQNIESFLSLQLKSVKDSLSSSAIEDAISRVQSMRILYDNLLVSKNLREVSLKSYIENLLTSLQNVFPENENIAIKKEIVDFNISAKKAITIGIIVNELLTNIFKYAFVDFSKGEIEVSVEKNNNTVIITIKDNGVGIDERVVKNKTPGFGLTIVKMLVQQLGGTYSIDNDMGTKSVVTFEV